MDLHQSRTGLILQRRHAVTRFVPGGLEDEFAGKGVTVGVQAGGRQANENVTWTDTLSGNQLVAVDDADDEASEVVFAVSVEAGHLRGLATNEGAAILLACLRQPSDHLLNDLIFEAAGREGSRERRGAQPLNRNVVDAVMDQVLPHCVMDAELEGDLEFGADAIRAGDQHGALISLEIRREERAEAADAAEYTASEGLLRERLDALFRLIATGDIDASVGVSDLFGLCCGQRDSF